MIETWLFAFCRIAPIVALHPVFGGRSVPRFVTIATAAALACAFAPVGLSTNGSADGAFLWICAGEVAIGATIGTLGQAVFGVIEAAGRFVDDARGANLAHLYAPQIEAVASPLGQFELGAALAVFWGLDLHAPMLRGFAASFDTLPAGTLPAGPALDPILEIATVLARAGLALAGPAAATCVLVDIAMGLVNRSAPTANVFLLSQPLKLTAAVLVTALGMPARVETWGELWHAHGAWIQSLFGR